MFNIKSILFIFYFLFATLITSGQSTLAFHNTYGIKHHTGIADLSIEKAIYYVENNQLHFEFFIKDDQVILENGQLNSDHLEFWFTVNEKTDVLYSMNTNDEHTGWYYYEVGDRQISPSKLHDQFRKDYIDFESWRNMGIDSAFYEAEVKTKKDFTGTVHWGIYTDTSILYDLRSYENMSSQLIPPAANKARYEIKDGGYSVKISFTPEQLLFLRKSKVSFQKLNIVVFDQDASGKSLHTLSNNYQWGEVAGFPSIKLNPSLTIGVSKTYTDFESSGEFYGHLYYFGAGTWELIFPSDDRIRFYQPYYYLSWDVRGLSREEVFIGKHRLFFYNEPGYLFFPSSNKWIHTDYELEQVKNIKTIRFKDSSIAFYNEFYYMQNPYGHGPCGACDHEQTDIYLLSEKGPKMILSADINMGNMLCLWREHNIEIGEGWMPEFDKQIWNMELEQLTVPAYNERDDITTDKNIVISWDKEWKPIVELKNR